MKTIGFLSRHCRDDFAEDFEELTSSGEPHPNRKKVIDYLKSGVLCVPLMGAVLDEDETKGLDSNDDSFFGYLSVYTDGEWIWPAYFISYLEKYPNYKVSHEFVQHVLKQRDTKVKVSKDEVRNMAEEFYDLTGFR